MSTKAIIRFVMIIAFLVTILTIGGRSWSASEGEIVTDAQKVVEAFEKALKSGDPVKIQEVVQQLQGNRHAMELIRQNPKLSKKLNVITTGAGNKSKAGVVNKIDQDNGEIIQMAEDKSVISPKTSRDDWAISGMDYAGGFREEGKEKVPATESFGVFASGISDDTTYCPEDPDERKAKCAQVNGYIRAYESQGQKAQWTGSVQRAYLFRAQCCGYRWTTEGPEGGTKDTTGMGRAGGWSGEIGRESMELLGVRTEEQDTQETRQQQGLEELEHAEQNWKDAEQFLRYHKQVRKQKQQEWERQMEKQRIRRQQIANDPEWQNLMRQNMQNLRNAAQGFSNAVRSGSSNSGSSGSSSGYTQQPRLHYLEQDPYKKRYRKYQKDTAQGKASSKPRKGGGYSPDSGSAVELLDVIAPKSD